MPKSNNKKRANRIGTIEAVKSPLGFYVLALLIIEAFLAVMASACNFQRLDRLLVILAGLAVFVWLIHTVTDLVRSKPTHLIFDQTSMLIDRGKLSQDGLLASPNLKISASKRVSKTDESEPNASPVSETAISRKLLQEFWEPADKKNNKQNRARLRKWMKANNLSGISMTTFIATEFFGQLRSQAIRDLGISPGGEHEKD